jgi:hypothetical protein
MYEKNKGNIMKKYKCDGKFIKNNESFILALGLLYATRKDIEVFELDRECVNKILKETLENKNNK